MANFCLIEKPFSVNAKSNSSKYKKWMDEHIAFFAANLQPCKNFPVRISITAVEGREIHEKSDIDNIIKPLVDAIVRAKIIPDDNIKFVEEVQSRFIPGSRRSSALIRIEIEEPG